MAGILASGDAATLAVVQYAALRQHLKSGDLLFCSGNYAMSRMIRAATGSAWSHVGLILRATEIDRVLLLESVEDVGVRFAPLSKYVEDYERGRPYNGRIVIARPKKLTGGQLVQLAQFGADQLTRPYDTEDISRIAARIALGLGRRKKDRAYICSELVAECFAAAGIAVTGSGGFVTPEDAWQGLARSVVGRIR
jgi:hypothetical protein